jgi:hypothetical protein
MAAGPKIVTGGGPPDLVGLPIFRSANTTLGNVKNAMRGTYAGAACEVPATLIFSSIAISSIVASTWPPWCVVSSSRRRGPRR